jgi:ABC-2 type transport system ATP-binding protein
MLFFDNVRKSYGSTVAVESLSLQIHRGEIFGLLGPNGAGKSTTVHLAVGLLEPDSGTVRIEGLGTPSEPSVRARIGVAPQALALYEELSGEENLRFLGRMYGLDTCRLVELTERALEFVGLADRCRDRVRTYSGGMKRRLNLAAAVLHDPDLVLLDEPTVGVDPQSRNSILENILALKKRGRTVMYTTHYMEEAERLCDRVAIVDHGRLLALDSVQGLIRAHGGERVLVVERGDGSEERIRSADPLTELNRISAARPVAGFRVERMNLEQVFLNLTGRRLRD